MICITCNKEIPDKSSFCPYCGNVAVKTLAESEQHPLSEVVQADLTIKQAKTLDALLEQQQRLFIEMQRWAAQSNRSLNQVSIVDFNMPFWSLVGWMLKASFASIPAAILFIFIISIVTSILLMLFAGLLAGLVSVPFNF